MILNEIVMGITPPSQSAMEAAKKRWDSIAKPLNSLGKLETLLIKIAGITNDPQYHLDKRALVVMCADNGVIKQGVTQTDKNVTALVAGNLAKGTAAANYFARKNRVDVWSVDIGVASSVEENGVLNYKVAYGTKDITEEPAMTLAETEQAIMVGIDLVRQLKEKNYKIIATGEMGIGNTTTSSALTAVFLRKNLREVTGRGAGLSTEGLARKIAAIEKAILINKPDANDALDTLKKVGGLDLAGLVGVFIGCAYYKLPVIIDGVISAAAALTAVKICPLVQNYLLPSHCSKEPAGQLLLEALELSPIIDGELALGEGTGALLLLPLLDCAEEIYHYMESFEQMQMEAYQPLH